MHYERYQGKILLIILLQERKTTRYTVVSVSQIINAKLKLSPTFLILLQTFPSSVDS